MAVDQDRIWELADALREGERASLPETSLATVSSTDEEGRIWVSIPGGEGETPTETTDAEVRRGDTVTVQWRGGKLYITGNSSNPSAGLQRVGDVELAASEAQQQANAAYESAQRAEGSAQEAGAAAARAVADAAEAETAAGEASTSAAAAAAAAAVADGKAVAAGNAASAAQSSADAAATAAGNAQAKADQAAAAAGNAQASADAAQASATTANTAANGALASLSTVQDVIGVLDWARENATYTLTQDTAIVPGKVYWTRSGSGTEADPYVYDPVPNPSAAQLSSYYEVSGVDEAMADYISTHLALTDEGLYIIADETSQNPGWKVLVSNSGVQIIDPQGLVASEFNGTAMTMGKAGATHITVSDTEATFYRWSSYGYLDASARIGSGVTDYGTAGMDVRFLTADGLGSNVIAGSVIYMSENATQAGVSYPAISKDSSGAIVFGTGRFGPNDDVWTQDFESPYNMYIDPFTGTSSLGDIKGYLPLSGGTMTGVIDMSGTTYGLRIKRPAVDTSQADNGITANVNTYVYAVRDGNTKEMGFLNVAALTSGETRTQITTRNLVNGSNVNNELRLAVAADGTRSVWVTDHAIWQSALQVLPLSGGTLTGALNGTTASFSGNVETDRNLVFGGGAAGTQYFITAKTPGRTARILFVGGGKKADGDSNGTAVGLGAGGWTIIGGGEYAQNRYNVGDKNDGNEELHLGADGAVYIEPNANTIANRATYTFGGTKFTMPKGTDFEAGDIIDFHISGEADGIDYMSRVQGVSNGQLHFYATNGGYTSDATARAQFILLYDGRMGVRKHDGSAWGSWNYYNFTSPDAFARALGMAKTAGDAMVLNGKVVDGYLTSSKTEIKVCIQTPYRFFGATTATVSATGRVRQNNTYILGSSTASVAITASVETVNANGFVLLNLPVTALAAAVNNDPVAIHFSELTITLGA